MEASRLKQPVAQNPASAADTPARRACGQGHLIQQLAEVAAIGVRCKHWIVGVLRRLRTEYCKIFHPLHVAVTTSLVFYGSDAGMNRDLSNVRGTPDHLKCSGESWWGHVCPDADISRTEGTRICDGLRP